MKVYLLRSKFQNMKGLQGMLLQEEKDGPFALGKREDGMQEKDSHSARAALWFSSYDWNKLLKFATKSSCTFFLWSGWQQYLPTS